MRIGELAEETGLSRDTLRFYEQRGLIMANRSANSYRTYAPETVELVRYIRTAQHLGFTLSEIGERLPALWNAEAPDQVIAELLTEKIALIDQTMAALASLRTELATRIAQTCPLLNKDLSR
jgi:MerR family copper efflux transcriptional regulator